MADRDIPDDELPLESAGSRLRSAREAAGLSLGDVAARTKIAERHLSSIEQSRFEALASRTYAVGFARAYARAVGLDEVQIAQAVRDELAAADNVRQPTPVDVFEPGDPARVPGSRLAWVAALGAIAVIGFVFVFWRSFFSPAVSLPELTAPRESPTAVSTSGAPAAPRASASTPVVFTATVPDVWVKFSDAAGNQLMQKQMAQGESYTVPANANGPLLRTARPDALQITVGGRIVPKLSDRPVSLKDVPVSAAALLGRAVPAPSARALATQPSAVAPANAPSPATQPSAAARPAASPAPTAQRRQAEPSPSPAASPLPAAAAPVPALAVEPAAVAPPETSTVSN